MKIEVGGIEVRLPTFVVDEHSSIDLLGMPWIKKVRAVQAIEHHGSLMMHIHSVDWRRAAAVKGDDEKSSICGKRGGWNRVGKSPRCHFQGEEVIPNDRPPDIMSL